MNILGYQALPSKTDTLVYSIAIDGNAVDKMVHGDYQGIPWRALLKGSLPVYEDYEHDAPIVPDGGAILAVCSCGISECAHIKCEIIKKDGIVTFKNFTSVDGVKVIENDFSFTEKNYDELLISLQAEVLKFREQYIAENKKGIK